MFGEIYLVRRPGDQPLLVRFEIPRISLVLRHEEYPVVLFDNMSVLPPLREVLVPRNGRENYHHQSTDAYFMMNYILDRNNFSDQDDPNAVTVLNNLRRLRMRRRRSLYDDDLIRPHLQILPYPMEYEEEDVPREIPRAARRAAGGGAGSAAAAAQAPPPVPAPRAQAPAPVLQAFTIRALIKAAIAENLSCPIAMTPIEEDSAAITTCQHIFDRDSITRWLTDHENCPVCRNPTTVCN